MYKLLALDLDGTVLSSDHTISPYLLDVLTQIKRTTQVVIATGRHHTAARPFYDKLGLETPTICCNGTYLYDYASSQVLRHNALSKEDALKFRALADEMHMKQVLYVTNSMVYSDKFPPEYIAPMLTWAQQYPEDQRPQICDSASFDDVIRKADYVWKFVLEGEPEDLAAMTELPWIKQVFNPEQSWRNRIDFSPRGNSKGNRLQEYMAEQGIKPDELVAAGDNFNDVSMLTLAGLGIAMNNATDKVKSYADKIAATDSNGDGLARLLEAEFLR